MAGKYLQKPRAPSPPKSPLLGRSIDNFFRSNLVDRKAPPLPSRKNGIRMQTSDTDTDDTYCMILDDQTMEFPPKKTLDNLEKKIPNRRLNNIRSGSLSSYASSTSSNRGGSLSNLYEVKQSDSTSLEQIRAKFQEQRKERMDEFSRLKNGHTSSPAGQRELNDIKDLQRGKSFLEARSAVQKQIEQMFLSATTSSTKIGIDKSTNNSGFSSKDNETTKDSSSRVPGMMSSLLTNPHNGSKIQAAHIKHSMHGISHALPGEELEFDPPPPVHYGMNQVLQSGSLVLNNRRLSDKKLKDFPSVEDNHQLEQKVIERQQETSSLHDKISTESEHLGNTNVGFSTSHQRNRGNDAESPTEIKPDRTPSEKIETFPVEFKKSYVRHKVNYLGALPITSSKKSTSLSALQKPLKDLYFKWLSITTIGQESHHQGSLEINDTGLSVQYIRELHKGVQEIFNPFSSIAVWAAVKFVHRRDFIQEDFRSDRNYILHRYAFLPLISDPEGNDKSGLYNNLNSENEVELASASPHPPIFACVMRRNGGQKVLECHGFVCSSSEDAIVIAANLYQALVETMKKQKSQKKKDKLEDENANGKRESESHVHVEAPIRPPRRKKVIRPVDVDTNSSGSGGTLERRNSMRRSVRSSRANKSFRGSGRKRPGTASTATNGFITNHPFRRSTMRLGRSDSGRTKEFQRRGSRRLSKPTQGQSERKNFHPQTPTMNGDVYTKVAIPRSKSFMNVTTRYNLQELFRELKEKEGVESVDDVLKKVITPNGISFNEIKPVYRELLLKLAMTMSQDEIFQRSKNIIQKEKKKQSKSQKKNKKKGKKTSDGSNSDQSTLGSFFRMTFSSSKPTNRSLSSSETLKESDGRSVSKRVLTKDDISGPIPSGEAQLGLRRAISLTKSTKVESSKHPIEDFVDDAYISCSDCGYGSACNYEDCTLQTQLTKTFKSEECDSACACDEDSFISSEKCYCSLGKNFHQKTKRQLRNKVLLNQRIIQNDSDTSSCSSGHSGCRRYYRVGCRKTTSHSQRSDSCLGSSGSVISSSSSSCCSCHINHRKQHHCCHLEGESHSSTSSIRPGCPTNNSMSRMNHLCQLKNTQNNRIKSLSQDNLTILPSGSMRSGCSCHSNWSESVSSRESFQRLHHRHLNRPKLSLAKSSNDLLSDIDLPTLSHPKKSLGQQKSLLVQAVDRSGKVVHHGASNPNLSRINEVASSINKDFPTDDHNIMSMKKSAEIASVFTGNKIKQITTSSGPDDVNPRIKNQQESFSEANIHSSLGYFP